MGWDGLEMGWRWLVGKREGKETRLEVWKKKGWGAAREKVAELI